LATQGVLSQEACLCVSGCGQVEDARHLFISCFLSYLWPLLRSWIGFEGAKHQDISAHFTQFIFFTGGLKSRRSFLQLIWLLSVGIMWNKHNNWLFNNKQNSIIQLLDKVMFYS